MLCDSSVAHVEITHDPGGSESTYYSLILAMAFASVNSLVLALSWPLMFSLAFCLKRRSS